VLHRAAKLFFVVSTTEGNMRNKILLVGSSDEQSRLLLESETLHLLHQSIYLLVSSSPFSFLFSSLLLPCRAIRGWGIEVFGVQTFQSHSWWLLEGRSPLLHPPPSSSSYIISLLSSSFLFPSFSSSSSFHSFSFLFVIPSLGQLKQNTIRRM
jgi:hypothetical protein